MKILNLLRIVKPLIPGGTISTAYAQDGEFSISGDCHNLFFGGVAFDGTNYLVVWADRYVGFLDDGKNVGMTNILGRFISCSGEIAGDKFPIVLNAYIKDSTAGAIHFNGSNYFFFYKEDDGT